ncbi:LPXTG cell wall anchor domain-containing protein [Enterococcus ureilyticus]|uniref:collagen binding domain-containing protein n=1 Tax=Enterococcus ureilyticus TaxID=1131292 RepID=UPI001A910465|nr:collagen binding domain-containing protein [Enterococcus ureilyticus]MBO0445127.1 LPXTG cell wall anchor domain-containing protein [Enterococcus ureilyticus]
MLKKLSWCVLLFVGFLGIVGFSQQSLAAELSSGGFVDSIHFDKTELSDGELTSIRVNFSEKSNTKLKAGDTLTLTLPKELEGLADSDSEPREIDLNGLGTVRVYKAKVIATFNEKVNQLDHVRGEFTFGVRVKNVPENIVTEIPANLGTSITVPNIVIKGHTSGGVEGENPFFYKTGDLLGKSGQIRWFLNANLNKSELGNDIVLTDISGGGQVLNKDSFVFTIDNYLGRSTLSLEEFENQRYGTVEFGADNAFVIRLYREKARLASFSIMYTATITEAGEKQPNFINDCQIDYQLYYEKATNETATHKVKNIFLDGNVTGEEEQRVKEPIEQEEIIEDESGQLEEITPLDPEQSKETKEEELNKGKEDQPEINVGEQTEIIEDESSELSELQPIEEEKAKESQEEDLNTAKEEQPEIHVGEQTEIIEDESITLEEIKSIEPEIVEVTEVPPLEPALSKKEIEVRQDKSVTEKIKPSGHAKGEPIPVKEEKKQPKNNHVLLTLSKRNTTKANEQLPQAGSNDSRLAVLAGLAMMVFTLGAYALNRKKITK